MQCVACGKAGCDDNHGNSDCLDNINPNQHILCLITSIEIIINSLNSIQNAPYLY